MQSADPTPEMELRSGNVKPGKQTDAESTPLPELVQEPLNTDVTQDAEFIPTHQLTVPLPAENEQGDLKELPAGTALAILVEHNGLIMASDADGYVCSILDADQMCTVGTAPFVATHIVTCDMMGTDFASEIAQIQAGTPVCAVQHPRYGYFTVTCQTGTEAKTVGRFLVEIGAETAAPSSEPASSLGGRLSTPSRNFRSANKQMQDMNEQMQRLARVTERTKKSVDNQNYKFDAVTDMLGNMHLGARAPPQSEPVQSFVQHGGTPFSPGQHAYPDQSTSFRSGSNRPDQTMGSPGSSYVKQLRYKQNQLILSNPGKLPKYKLGESEESVPVFLCDTVWKFACNQDVAEPQFVRKWLHMCFPQTQQARVDRMVGEALATEPNCTLFDFLTFIAREFNTVSPLDVDVVRQVSKYESVEDFYHRVRIELRVARVHPSEINRKIVEFLLKNEPNAQVKMEIRRALTPTPAVIQDSWLLNKCKIIDQLTQAGRIDQDVALHDQEIIRHSMMQAKVGQPAEGDSRREKNSRRCQECGRDHVEENDGKIYTHCRNCFLKLTLLANNLPAVRYDAQGQPLYFDPNSGIFKKMHPSFMGPVRQGFDPTLKIGNGWDYKLEQASADNNAPYRAPANPVHSRAPQTDNRQNGNYNGNKNWSRNRGRSESRSNNQWRNSSAKTSQNNGFTPAAFTPAPATLANIPPVSEDHFPILSSVASASDILKGMTDADKIRPRDLAEGKSRIVAVTEINGHQVPALIDNGSNKNTISESLVKQCGLSNLVEKHDGICTGFNGSESRVEGRIPSLSMKVGKLSYEGEFIVLPALSTYPMTLGCTFLIDVQVHEKLQTELQKLCGQNVIRRDF